MQPDLTVRPGHPVSVTEMTCRRCERLLPADAFPPDPRYRTGLQSWCRECKRDDKRERIAADPALAERERQRQREDRAANPDRHRAKARRSYQRHADKRRADRLAYRASHLEHERNRDRAHKRAMPKGYHAEIQARMRARRHGALWEPLDYQVILARDGLVCHICGGDVPSDKVEMDHVIPLAGGGTHTYGNVRVAHGRCNRLKLKQDLAVVAAHASGG